MKKLSIVVPVWNEEKNIGELITRIHIALKNKKIQYEIIFIDDHSSDKTVEAINLYKNNYPVVVFPK
ncbi:MAG TPA: glycosyltransferase, partial [Patescibacteria group bacterium]